MQKIISILVCCLCANAVLGSIIISSPDSGGSNQDWLEGKEFRRDEPAENIDFANDEMSIGNQVCLDRGGPVALFADVLCILPEGRPDADHAYLSVLNTPLDAERSVAGIDDIAAGCEDTADLQNIRINTSDEQFPDMDFVLEGALYIDWTGTAISKDEMEMRVTMSQIPEPASIVMVIMVSGLGLIIRRRFRP